MAKKLSEKKPVVLRTRAEELEILEASSKRMREDRAYALKLLQDAGILNKKGQLAKYYRHKA